MYGDSETVRRILTESGDTWAIVGLSGNERRAAYGVARVLQRFGKRIVPVHPKAEAVHGEQGYATLAEIPFPVMLADVDALDRDRITADGARAARGPSFGKPRRSAAITACPARMGLH